MRLTSRPVTQQAKQAYEAWKVADAAARAAEGRLREAWDQFDRLGGEPPAPGLMAEVSRLRAVANDRLTVAMMQMGTTNRGAAL
jgi:ferric-dicitrate binding protein FerR (iron transport regulator)